MGKEITFEINKPLHLLIIGILIFVLVQEILVTTKTPINFGDEGFHTRLAQWIAQEKEIPKFYDFEGSDISRSGFHRPPLWNILEGSFFLIFGFNELIPKILTPIISFMLGLSTFILVKKIFNETTSFFSTVMIVTAPAIVTYSVLFYTDLLLTLFLNLFFLTIILAVKSNEKKYWLLSSIFGSLAILSKVTAYTVIPFIGLVFLYQFFFDKKRFDLKNYALFGIILLVLISTYFVRNLAIYGDPTCRFNYGPFDTSGCIIDNFEEQYEFGQRTVDQGTESDIFKLGILNYLNFAYGEIWLITFGFISGLILLFSKKRKIINAMVFFVFTVFILFVFLRSTGRAEDTSRYTLGWLPFICLIAGIYFSKVFEFIKKYQKYVAFIVFAFVIFLSYKNLTQKTQTMIPVKSFSPTFFEACDWVKENVDEDALLMTVWSHRAVFNCQRKTIGNMPDISLSYDSDYIVDVAEQHGITHFFIQKFSLSNQEMAEKYPIKFVQILENDTEHFENIFENGPSLEQCLSQGTCDGNIIYEIKY